MCLDWAPINTNLSKDAILHNVKRIRTKKRVKHDTKNSWAVGQTEDVHLQGPLDKCPILTVLFSRLGIFFLDYN